ncbi:hypothetical protein [Halocynthiibacter sp.]|uniref:hypothetical protein n=1 Tax=Halocynthiibacter sp. TaxID=1979210 RepID=UPI003C420C8D
MRATILCIKWGTAFDASEVNLLYRACRDNVPGELRFVCLTDNRDGLLDGIEAREIPDIGLAPAAWKLPGVWRKLSLFSDEISDLGRVLFIDLDMMIVGDLQPFFDQVEGSRFLNVGKSWYPGKEGLEKEVGTGVYSYDIGENAHVLTAFVQDMEGHMQNWQNEQDFVGAHADAPSYWPEGLVLSFKRHLCHRYGKGLFVAPSAPPASARIIAFHGNPRPVDTVKQTIWGPAPHWHAGTPNWIIEYRQRYGGDA